MDLPTLKSTVKAWEKAFRAREGRLPTKEDIKQDPTGISEKYNLYRRLTKQSTQSQSTTNTLPPPSSISTSTHASSSAGPSRTQTPRTIQPDEYPTTPTPKSRRSTSRTTEPSSSKRPDDALPPLRNNKRPAPEAQSPSSARLFTTPKKPRPSYTGPIHDPNPINPFSATPPRPGPSSSSNITLSSNTIPTSKDTGQSPFLHATSPKKLKELLQSNSLRKVKERQEEITPRSKARLRLTGDFVTPMKDKQPKRRRGEARLEGELSRVKGKQAMTDEDVEEESEEDEFGPSPMRPGISRTFTELLQATDDPPVKPTATRKRSTEKKRDEKQPDLLGFFGRAKSKIKVTPEEPVDTVQFVNDVPTVATPVDEAENDILQGVLDTAEADPERLPTPPPDEQLEAVLSQGTPVSTARAQKVFSFSDDEEDEWDPEGGHVRRQVVVTGTRREVKRRGSLSSERNSDGAEAAEKEDSLVGEDEDDDYDNDENVPAEDADGSIPTLTIGETATSPAPSSPRSVKQSHMPLLSLLSLRSPAKAHSSKLDELRVKAIFNPSDATRLKAAQKGQDIYVCGEGVDGDEDGDVLETYEFDGVEEGGSEFGDDDWEQEPEGWKKTQLGMDDW